jgi:hypothetical protein
VLPPQRRLGLPPFAGRMRHADLQFPQAFRFGLAAAKPGPLRNLGSYRHISA